MRTLAKFGFAFLFLVIAVCAVLSILQKPESAVRMVCVTLFMGAITAHMFRELSK